ncbi:MAG: Rrf2 family transcriptional regulator [Oscillospiraceae bacterium]|nr:Rrf2 family transcriptional regulator [Oscillospiraceae bacterium]
MLLSRETDYALRILQSLMEGERKSVGEISKEELIPQQFAYKIIKKLSNAGLVDITRGVDGGCKLIADLEEVSLYDLMAATDGICEVNNCMSPAYECPRREKKGGCVTQRNLISVQRKLDNELRSYTLKSLLS